MVTKPNDDSSLSHTRWNCKYHIVFIPKYRRKVIYEKLKGEIGRILSQLCGYKDVEIMKHKIICRPKNIRTTLRDWGVIRYHV